MKSFSFKAALAALLLGLASSPAHAIITPQKYCESLAATSCEVLNIDAFGTAGTASVGLGVLKYCKNRDLKFMAVGGTPHGTNGASLYVAGLTSGSIGNTSITNTTLCTNLP